MYQHLMGKIFNQQISKNMEVHVDDMIIISVSIE